MRRARSDPRPLRAFATGALLLAGCSDPAPLVFCHNANCAQPASPSDDDTLESLRRSLSLRYEGRPVIDGVELDAFWNGGADGGKGRCELAHELSEPPKALATDAAEAIAAWLRANEVASWNGQWFTFQVEMKGFVASLSDKHTPEQAAAHAGCVLDMFDIVESAAHETGKRVELVADSSAPNLLESLQADPRWKSRVGGETRRYRTAADFVDNTPSGFAFQYLEDFPPVTDVVFHGGWLSDGHYQAFRSMGLDLTMWMFTSNDEALGAIRKFRPRAVITNDAEFFRRWEER